MGESNEHWGVVGGGMLGLTLAWRLAQAGRRVTLIEAADRLGGVADAWSLDGVRWDRHYHVICLSDSVLRRLLGELGLEREIDWVQTRTGFYGPDGRLVSISNNLDILRNLPLGLFDKLRLGATIFYASQLRDGRRLEQVPVSDWLRRLSGRRVFEQLWLPLLRAKLGENYQVTSASFIWAVIRRLSKARQMGFDKEKFGYVPGGYARILAAFSEALDKAGVEVSLSTAVENVEPAGGRVLLRTGNGHGQVFDQVALTLPAPVAARLCPGFNAEETQRLRGITYQGLVCASLLLRRSLAEYYLTYVTDREAPFSAVVEMSALVDAKRDLDGHVLVYLPKYVRGGDPLLEASDAEIEASFLAGLGRMYPGFSPADVLCFRVSKVRYLLPLATLGYSDRLPPVTTSVPGVHVVNSAHIVNGTLNVNETMELAENAAARFVAGPGAAS